MKIKNVLHKKFTKKLNISLDNSDFYNSFYLLKIKVQILH